jgi:hypothetical protein
LSFTTAMRVKIVLAALLLAVLTGSALQASAQTPAKLDKADIVAVTGCLKESAPNTWTLINATEPVASNANAPSPKEVAAAPKKGTSQYQLIGVTVFNLPAHKDQTVLIKGLHIKATPMSRLNITSVTTVAPSCEP